MSDKFRHLGTYTEPAHAGSWSMQAGLRASDDVGPQLVEGAMSPEKRDPGRVWQ